MATDVNFSLPAFYSKIPKGYGDVLDREKAAIQKERDAYYAKKKTKTTIAVIIAVLVLAVLVAAVCYFLKIKPYWIWVAAFVFLSVPTVLLTIKLKSNANDKELSAIAEKMASYRRRKNAYRDNLHAYEILEQAHIKNFAYGGGRAYIQYELGDDGKRKAINLEYIPYKGGDEDYPEEVMIFYKDHIEARGGVEADISVSTTFMGE